MTSIMSVINSNKVAFLILALVLVALVTFLVFAVTMQSGGLEIAGISTMRYCVTSGGVCTGG
ncbi:MAG: hypothetical protein H6653_12910 [Ardenticatenaceae bacterium]|nr:hypothetical protein [Ardenticatenaceae bacterium]